MFFCNRYSCDTFCVFVFVTCCFRFFHWCSELKFCVATWGDFSLYTNFPTSSVNLNFIKSICIYPDLFVSIFNFFMLINDFSFSIEPLICTFTEAMVAEKINLSLFLLCSLELHSGLLIIWSVFVCFFQPVLFLGLLDALQSWKISDVLEVWLKYIRNQRSWELVRYCCCLLYLHLGCKMYFFLIPLY